MRKLKINETNASTERCMRWLINQNKILKNQDRKKVIK